MACKDTKLKGVTPLEHQLKVANYINKEKTFFSKTSPKAVVVFHSVGSGKTITSILSATCFLGQNPGSKVIILTPTSVVNQFWEEIKKTMDARLVKRVYIYSYTKWINKFRDTILESIEKKETDKKDGKNVEKKEEESDDDSDVLLDADIKTEFILPDDCMLIVDEAHKFKTETTVSHGLNMARTLNEAALRAKKVLLLTATPIVNEVKELRNYMAIVNDTTFEKMYRKAPKKLLEDKSFLKSYVKCGFSYFYGVDKDNYPVVIEHPAVKIPMDQEYESLYTKVQDNQMKDKPELLENFPNDPLPFLNGIRKAVNFTSVDSPKIKWVLDKINDELKFNRKTLVYSSFKGFGVERIKLLLDASGIPANLITGSVPKEKRFKYAKEFSEGKVPILLISAAGAEGLDLKGTRNLIILEPYWNDARLEQVKGRAIRYKSHSDLPPEERVVNVYTLVLTKSIPVKWAPNILKAKLTSFIDSIITLDPKTVAKSKLKLATADEILLKLSEEKSKKIMELTSLIINGSIENNMSCSM